MRDQKPAPSLMALGGWEDAEWFNPNVLSDSDIVAFALPAVRDVRKQSFRIVERTSSNQPTKAELPPAPNRSPRRLAGKLALLLDSVGAIRAVACCRSRLLFESSPILFFAELLTSRLKQRSANKLRRELLGIGVRACVLRSEQSLTTVMFWTSSETDITDFIARAAPEHLTHPDFDQPPKNTPIPTAKARDVPARRPNQVEDGREMALLKQITALQTQVEILAHAQSPVGAMKQLGLDDTRLKSMLKLLHPDKHGNSEAAHEAAVWVNGMRELLQGKSSE